MSHVRSNVVKRVEEYFRKIIFVDDRVFFDRVLELSGPTSESRAPGVSRTLSKFVSLVVNIPRYSALLEFDVRKYALFLSKYLEKLRDSLEASVTLSSLLAGVLTTVAVLVLVVVRSAS